MCKNVTLYANDKDRAVIDRAMKLLAWHEDKSMSQFLVEQAKAIVQKYDGIEEGK